MGKGLAGKRIAIGASRNTGEISTLIQKQGGTPVIRSLQGTVFLAEKEVEPGLQRVVREGVDWAIFTTGIGTETLLGVARKLGIEEQFIDIIHQAKVASRGYKTFSTLKELGVKPVAVDGDGTIQGLIRSLEGFDFREKR